MLFGNASLNIHLKRVKTLLSIVMFEHSHAFYTKWCIVCNNKTKLMTQSNRWIKHLISNIKRKLITTIRIWQKKKNANKFFPLNSLMNEYSDMSHILNVDISKGWLHLSTPPVRILWTLRWMLCRVKVCVFFDSNCFLKNW